MDKIKEWAKKLGIGSVIVVLIYITCIGKTHKSGHGANYTECKMLNNEGSDYVASVCLPNSQYREEENRRVYVETYEEEDVARKVFREIVEKICSHHGNNERVSYGHRDEMIFVCYGSRESIVVDYHDLTLRGGKKIYCINIEYVDTEAYDWDYLSSRIKN